MSFCKKSFHSFLTITNLSDSPPASKYLPSAPGIGLMTATGETRRPPNVLESATVRPPPPTLFADDDGPRKEPDGIGILRVGFFDEVGEVVDGLMSCTESLGFESSDERRVEDERVGDNDMGDSDPKPCMLSRAKKKEESQRIRERKFPPPLRAKKKEESQRIRERKFPPPLKSWNDKGRPIFFLKPMRRDGRLELTEVRIKRPEILRASRGDGRLRLEFFNDPEFEADNEEIGTKDVTDEDDAEEEERKVAIPGEGLGRCYEAVVTVASRGHHLGSGDDNHNLNVWRQRCVTIR